jgi:hypothetical protein
MSNRSREKGLKGEREVAQMLTDAGWTVRGLEGSGDCLAIMGPRYYDLEDTYGPDNVTRTLHVEVKRYAARARWEEWLTQVQADAPNGVPWVLVTRADRRQALATLPLAALLELIA